MQDYCNIFLGNFSKIPNFGNRLRKIRKSYCINLIVCYKSNFSLSETLITFLIGWTVAEIRIFKANIVLGLFKIGKTNCILLGIYYNASFTLFKALIRFIIGYAQLLKYCGFFFELGYAFLKIDKFYILLMTIDKPTFRVLNAFIKFIIRGIRIFQTNFFFCSIGFITSLLPSVAVFSFRICDET